ncbi:TetR/AcrR family transcriptional regulator [Micromonospora sp. NPDC004336]
MGQREDLLAGAKRCLAERGYAHTTARDIVAVTGANLASIGYHFGSKDALLNAAVIETFEEWGDAVADAVTADLAGTPAERLEQFLVGLLGAAPEKRNVLVASVQAYAQAEFAAEVHEQLLRIYADSRRDLAALVLAVHPDDVSPDAARTVGSLALALINGVMLQWMLDPASTPSAGDLAQAIRTLSN